MTSMLSRVGWTTLQPTHLIVHPMEFAHFWLQLFVPILVLFIENPTSIIVRDLLQSRLLEICFAIHSVLME